jgi:hypothetical protein
MTQAEARMRILEEFRTWVGHRKGATSHTSAEALVFFKEIQQNHADLLSFEGSEDKRHLVNRWLLDAGLIKG